jgi:two-component system, NarL family, response regulator DevR
MGSTSSASTAPNLEMIRIVLVEPRALVGLGIRGVLDGEPDMEVVAEVRSAVDALAVAEDHAPDVFVLDLPLQEPSTSAATHRLAQEAPGSGMVVVGREDDDASILEAIEIGARGHVAAVAEPAELVAVIRKVADGEDPLTEEVFGRPDLVDKIMEGFRESYRRAEGPSTNPLTARELDVLRHVAEGMGNREVGAVLDVREQTVKNHLASILHKLGVPNRTRAVTFAVRQGWLVLDEGPGDSEARPQDDATWPSATGTTRGA